MHGLYLHNVNNISSYELKSHLEQPILKSWLSWTQVSLLSLYFIRTANIKTGGWLALALGTKSALNLKEGNVVQPKSAEAAWSCNRYSKLAWDAMRALFQHGGVSSLTIRSDRLLDMDGDYVNCNSYHDLCSAPSLNDRDHYLLHAKRDLLYDRGAPQFCWVGGCYWGTSNYCKGFRVDDIHRGVKKKQKENFC